MNSLSPENKKLVIAGIAAVLLALLWWGFAGQKNRRSAPTESAPEEVRRAAEAASGPKVEVPTSANPIKEVLPEETPLEKTNPFNKIYENPFK